MNEFRSPKVIFRQKSELALNSKDRKLTNELKVKRSVINMFDYFADEKKKALHLIDYFTGKIGKEEDINLILENGKYATEEEIEKRKKSHVKYIEKANLYKCILSFPKSYIDENISYEKLEQEFIKTVLPKFLKRVGFKDLNKMCYQASLHCNTDNPHFHFSFIEKEPNYQYKRKIGYRQRILFEKEDINFLKNYMIHTIEKEKYYTPLLTKTNKEIDELKTYFKPSSINFILKDKENIELETKLLELGEMLNRSDCARKVKYNSLTDKQIKKLTKEIKSKLLKDPKIKKINKEIDNLCLSMENYFSNIAKENNINKEDFNNDLIKYKLKNLDNYILNSIVNHANYKFNKEKLLKEIIKREYNSSKQKSKYQIVKNYLTKKDFIMKGKVEKAIKNINDELDEAKSEFSKLFEIEKNVEK